MDKRVRQKNVWAYLLLAAMPLFFVSNLIIGRAVANTVAPWTLACLRWLVASLILVPLAWGDVRRHRAAIVAERGSITILAFLGMWVCGGMVYVALQATTATNGTLIYSASPVLVVVLDAILKRQRLPVSSALGVAAGVSGVAIIVLRGDLSSLLATQFNVGDFGFVLAAAAWAVYSLILKRTALQSLPSWALFFAISVAGTAMLLPFMAWEVAASGEFPLGWMVWLSIIGVAVLPSVLAFSSYQYGVKVLGPSVTSVFMYLLPRYGVLLAIAFLGERFHTYHAVGLVLVLAGVVMTTRGETASSMRNAPHHGG